MFSVQLAVGRLFTFSIELLTRGRGPATIFVLLLQVLAGGNTSTVCPCFREIILSNETIQALSDF